jgi:hypothetical protein
MGLVLSQGVLLALLSLVWIVVEWGGPARSALRRGMPCLVVLISSWSFYSAAAVYFEVPTWKMEERVARPIGLDPSVRYLSAYIWPDVIGGHARGSGEGLFPGNSPMYAGLRFANGYSPMHPRGMTEVLGFNYHGVLVPDCVERLLARETRPDGLLQLMAVDGLIVADRFESHWQAVEANGWRLEAFVPGGGVFYRQAPPSPRVRTIAQAEWTGSRATALELLTGPTSGPVPLVLLRDGGPSGTELVRFAPLDVTPVEEWRNSAAVDVRGSSADGESLVVFARPWFPGYRASLDGRPVPVELLNLTMPAVRVPAGSSGRLVLEYRPRSLVLGCYLAAAAGTLALLALALTAGQRLLRRA